MKNRSRLTALLLALLMLMSALPVPALADDVITTMDDYQDAMQRLKDALNEPSIPQEQENAYTITRSAQIDAIVHETITGVIAEDGDNTFTLPVAGKLMLSTAEAAEAYQWQISADGVWANIVGDSAAEIALTYAKIQNALSGGAAIVRCALTRGGEVSYSPEAIVAVDMTPKTETTTVEETIPAVSYYAPAAQSQARALNAYVLEANDAPSTHTILINYIFADGTQAAPSWSATVATGSTYTQDIQSPVVVGYTPDQAVVHVEASATKPYTVTYQPAEVEFTVKHYQQNVSNDEYTLVDTETKKGYTKSPVGEGLAKTESTGFYSLLYNTTTEIAADGSTVVEVYYDRYYYLMNFDLDGGYGVEPIYARYGAEIGNVAIPVKAGYVFGGWSLDDVKQEKLPDTMPAKNKIYKAIWTPVDTAKVTIVFWGENADDEEYSYIKSSTVNVKTGKVFTYSENGSLICALEEHTHKQQCYKFICNQEEHTHSSSCRYACGKEEHRQHSTACYAGVREEKTLYTDTPNDPVDGYVFSHWYYNGNFIYINGKYYRYTGSTSAGNVAPAQCSGLHTHSANCGYACGKEEHTHTGYTGSCYELTCGETEHTHNSSCYMSGAGLDSNRWTFKKSDTVTVAADGSSVVNVYYDRVEYSVQFYKNQNCSADREYADLRITAKWGQSILSKWPTYNGSSSWYVKDKDDTWQNSIQTMPVGGAKFWGPKKGNGSYKASYYVEVLPGEDGTQYNGVTYKLHHEDVSVSSGTVTDEERYEIKGFTYKEGTDNGNSYDNAKFYYTRNTYTLTFNDGYNDVKSESVKYEAPLSTYSSYVPEVPSAYEPGSVTFGGWYLNPECTGAEYKLSKHTMPADNVLLYAKWVPVTHTVKTYLTKDVLDNGGDPLNTWSEVPHGTAVTNPPADPEKGNYTFVGWFYISDTGEEKAFDFSMPVNRDLNLYAKWSSNTLMDYTIKYELEDGTEIAPPTTGSALAGSTKTFEAKTGTQLHEGYQSGYFPKVSSHSLTMDIEDASKNEFTFVYVAKDEVEYTVRYLDKATGEPVVVDGVPTPDKVVKTRDAVVTETFKQIKGYAPDAYQKQLVLAADNNQIIFWYTKDTEHAPVQTIHWIQNIEGDGYTEYQSSTNLNAKIGKEQPSTALTIPGFTYVKGTAVAGETTTNFTKPDTPKATLTEAGLVLNLYYDRIEYPYEFRFVEKDSDPEKQLADSVTGTARYQAQVTQTAKDIPGYTLVSAENQAIHIAIEDGTAAVKNVRTFYYTEQTVDIKYEVVGPTGCGTLDNDQEAKLKVINGTVNGSVPTAAKNFKFVGWYKNQACTQPVDADWVKDSKLTPDKTKNYGTAEKPVMGYEAATYYAKFEYNLTTLTITKQGMNDIDAGQSFLFKVTGEGLPKDGLLIAINGNGSETISGLTVGQEYTVTEVESWSWRYTANGGQPYTITLQPNGNTLTIINTRDKVQWLDGDCYRENNFGAVNSGK